ncbi:hypothetical protein ILYODFUR_029149 [Ilyodon furcidens]|uniref:Uncharacterized protein n=1 Tax=Ilyodon furcidens TaxID=33524 RepID=A0ABV0TFW8_9TELE
MLGFRRKEFVNKVRIWLKENESMDDGNVNDVDDANVQVEKHCDVVDDGVNPEDSVSNISSKRSKRSHASSTSSARKQAMAEALKKKHELNSTHRRKSLCLIPPHLLLRRV